MLTIDVDPEDETINRLRAGHVPLPGEVAVELVPLGDGRTYWIPRRFDLISRSNAGQADWRMAIAVKAGIPRCQRIVFETPGPDSDVRAADLRQLRIEDMVEFACKYVTWKVRHDAAGRAFREPMNYDAVQRNITLPAVRSARRITRLAVNAERLREVAEIYRTNIDSKPTLAVQRHLGCAERTARLWVWRTREAGLLGASLTGKAGEAS